MKSIIIYFQFFTAIPIPIEIDDVEERYRSGIYLFPIFGILYGGIHAILFYLLRQCFSLSTVWVLMLVFDVIITRGFHYDALSDMADGMFSSRKKERILAIMKDSTIGAMGVLALIIYFLGMYHFGIENLESRLSLLEQVKYIWIMKALSRGGLCSLFINFRYSGATQGLGTMLIGMKRFKLIIAQIIFAAFALVVGGIPYLWTYGIMLILLWGYRYWIIKNLDGLNGDTSGASALISEWLLHLIFTAF